MFKALIKIGILFIFLAFVYKLIEISLIILLAYLAF